MSTDTTSLQDYTFKAEIKQLLDILVHSLYKERDIFLRELLSNASDALTRLHFESLTNHKILNPETPLAIHVDVVKSEADDAPKQIVIKDSGIGIPEADQPRLFDTFYRARNVGAIEGTGLGLAIVKRSVEAHGGTIAFESEAGVGTSFVISLPLYQT